MATHPRTKNISLRSGRITSTHPRTKNISLRSGRITSVHFWTMTVASLHQSYLFRQVMIFPSALTLPPARKRLKQSLLWKPTKQLALIVQLLQRLSKEVATRWLIPSMPSARRCTPACHLLNSGYQMSSSHYRKRVICLKWQTTEE